MKKCPNCNQEFEPITYRGVEQVYCSKKCRTRQGNLRHKQKLINNGMEQSNRSSSRENTETTEQQRTNYDKRQTNLFEQQQPINDTNVFRYIEQCYEARTDAIKFELKYEQAIQELNLCKSKLAAFEMDLEEEPEPAQGIAGILENIPEWLSPAIGKLLQHEKVQNFILSQIPEKQN